jgi:hypothetical protein
LTHLQPKATGITSIAVVSINEGLQIGNWKDINKDFNQSRNKKELKYFELHILKKIRNYLE